MKKVVALVLCAVMLLALCACTKTNTETETINGITKTTTTTTDGDKTTTEIVYKDSNGNTLDPDLGEAAFALAEAGDQNPLETAKANAAAAEAPAAEAATEEAAAEEEQTYVATLTFSNEAEADINEIYLVLNEDTSWGSNVLEEPLEVGQTITFSSALTYRPSTPFALDIVDADGAESTFSDFDFSGLSDPENIMITISLKDNGDYTIRIS